MNLALFQKSLLSKAKKENKPTKSAINNNIIPKRSKVICILKKLQ